MMDATQRAHMDLFERQEGLPERSFLHSGVLGFYASPFHRAGRLWRRYTTHRRLLAGAVQSVESILPAIPSEPGAPSPADWQVLQAHWTITDVAVIAVGPADGPPAAFIKVPGTREGLLNIRRQASVLRVLQDDSRLCDLRTLLPTVLAEGEVGERGWVAERALAGCELRTMRDDGDIYTRGVEASARFIGALHDRTAQPVLVDAALLNRWVDAPLDLLRRLTHSLLVPSRYEPILERVRRDLHDALRGREVQAGWIHGDFWPSNVLVSAGGEITGVVDWERAAPDELPLHDLLHLVLHSSRLESAYRDLGATVRALLGGVPLTEDEWALLRSSPLPVDATPEGLRLMLLLYWLRYVATYLAKVPDQALNQWWLRRNVGDVLRSA